MVNTEFYKNKRILITGDTGFKGSWLAYILNSLGAKVFGYALPAVNNNDHYNLLSMGKIISHEDGNILDSEYLNAFFKKIKPEIVFHLAAQAIVRDSYKNPKLTIDTNVGGSVNVLEAIRKSKTVKSFIYVTSDKCYKNKEWLWGYRENDELGGHDPYSASKAAAEFIFSSYKKSFFHENNHVGIGTVRAGNVIGGGDWANDRIIPDCIRALSNNQPIIIRNPHATRPWQHVLDPLFGYLLLAEKLYFEPKLYSGAWNFGPDTKSIKTVKEIAEKVIAEFGKGELQVQTSGNNPHEASVLHLNCDKSNSKLQWFPRWDYNQTIIRTIKWYKEYLEGKTPSVLTKSDINKYIEDKT